MATDAAWMVTGCVCTSIRRVDRALSRLYDDALRPSRLVTTQYALLSTLAKAPADLPLTALAGAMVMDRSTLSRNLAPLERADLLRLGTGADRRTRHVSITDAGRVRLAEARPLWRTAHDRVTAIIGDDQLGTLLGQLAAIVPPVRSATADDE